ncbi:hypothetical protein DPMN_001987 [Dreissena polymorpha]|uniref:Uncharacterized protein n=1 Tax=Dreissena polymorpha TaxID=45954 RepID=A0A9D4CUT0_DREPO|nr:hypothetical protein DPMN_057274 [Dreissena polymorpha]KAH3878104.1 hypothetical protein DPMN_001987 [Dreissena polymorpha]
MLIIGPLAEDSNNSRDRSSIRNVCHLAHWLRTATIHETGVALEMCVTWPTG